MSRRDKENATNEEQSKGLRHFQNSILTVSPITFFCLLIITTTYTHDEAAAYNYRKAVLVGPTSNMDIETDYFLTSSWAALIICLTTILVTILLQMLEAVREALLVPLSNVYLYASLILTLACGILSFVSLILAWVCVRFTIQMKIPMYNSAYPCSTCEANATNVIQYYTQNLAQTLEQSLISDSRADYMYYLNYAICEGIPGFCLAVFLLCITHFAFVKHESKKDREITAHT